MSSSLFFFRSFFTLRFHPLLRLLVPFFHRIDISETLKWRTLLYFSNGSRRQWNVSKGRALMHHFTFPICYNGNMSWAYFDSSSTVWKFVSRVIPFSLLGAKHLKSRTRESQRALNPERELVDLTVLDHWNGVYFATVWLSCFVLSMGFYRETFGL